MGGPSPQRKGGLPDAKPIHVPPDPLPEVRTAKIHAGGGSGFYRPRRSRATETVLAEFDLARIAGLAKGDHPVDANLLHRLARRLQVITRIKLLGMLGENLADRPRNGQSVVGIHVDLSDTVLDAALNLLHWDTPGLADLATVFVDNVLQFLRN